ncbi:MAG: amidohydrolase family protein [Luteitalea sp.]|nr:amidohydrolase family protein [Luteitalea sp.]
MQKHITVISRRRLLGVLGTAALAGNVWDRSTAAEEISYIDVHTHPGPFWHEQGIKELTLDDFLRWMDRNNVERSCVLAHVSPEGRVIPIPPVDTLRAARRHPDRLIPFTSVDPRADFGKVQDLVGMLKWYEDQGAKGFGEHKPGLPIDHPLCFRVYEACEMVGLPLLLHMDGRCNTDSPGLPGLRRVLQNFPTLNLIAHGPLWWASISASVASDAYPKGKVAPGGAVDTLMDAFPNLYADLSAGSGANGISRDRKFGRDFLIRRADKLMFGSDYLRPNQVVSQFELLPSFELPVDVRRKIYRDNAIRLLKL